MLIIENEVRHPSPAFKFFATSFTAKELKFFNLNIIKKNTI
jgi:hypothetical protein